MNLEDQIALLSDQLNRIKVEIKAREPEVLSPPSGEYSPLFSPGTSVTSTSKLMPVVPISYLEVSSIASIDEDDRELEDIHDLLVQVDDICKVNEEDEFDLFLMAVNEAIQPTTLYKSIIPKPTNPTPSKPRSNITEVPKETFRRYPKIEYDSIAEDDTIMEVRFTISLRVLSVRYLRNILQDLILVEEA